MPKKIVSDPTQDATPKPNRKEPAEEPVKEFKAKLNKYGFIYVPKKAVPSLPFETKESLTARIEGETLVIAATPRKST
jgi:hypothetical protein